MPNSYHQLIVHIVFSVKYRQCLIHKIEEKLYRYITGVIQSDKNKCKLIAIGGTADHVHLLVNLHPMVNVSTLIKEIKTTSSLWINSQNIYMGKFHWQDGYGAFSLGMSQLDIAINYIRNQKEHHKRISFHDEMVALLKKYHVEFDERFIGGAE